MVSHSFLFILSFKKTKQNKTKHLAILLYLASCAKCILVNLPVYSRVNRWLIDHSFSIQYVQYVVQTGCSA